MSNQYGPRIVTDGLVLHLDAANRKSYPGTGTAWNDLSGNGNHGTFGASTSAPTFTNEKGGAIVFDGSGDYVSTTDIDLTTLTLSCWFRPDINSDGSTVRRLISKNLSFALQSDSGTTVYAKTIVVHNGSWKGVTNTSSINANSYYNLVGTYDGTNLSIYTNGVLSATTTITGGNPSQNDSVVYIGGESTTLSFDGSIFITKIYNRTLSANEVQQNYNALKGRFGL